MANVLSIELFHQEEGVIEGIHSIRLDVCIGFEWRWVYTSPYIFVYQMAFKVAWKLGKTLVFDDSFTHAVRYTGARMMGWWDDGMVTGGAMQVPHTKGLSPFRVVTV